MTAAADTPNGMRRWVVRCQCGTTRTVYEANLNTKSTRSCGCLHRELLTKRNQEEQWRVHLLTLTYEGQQKTVKQWAEETGIHRATIYSRRRRGWPIKRILGQ